MRALVFVAFVLACATGHGQSLKDLHPQSERMLRNHSDHYIRTPDGTYWDLWGEREYLEVFNRVVKCEPIKERRSQGNFIEMVTVGMEWVIEDTRESLAWGIEEDNRPPKNDPPISYYNRDFDGLPPLWRTLHGSVVPDFIYINEVDRDIVSIEDGVRCTWVTHDLGDNLFTVEVRQGRGVGKPQRRASRQHGTHIVYIADPRAVIKDGFLNGEFILWADPQIVPPPEVVGRTYRYISISELRPTQDELAEAVHQSEAELVTWKYARDGRFWRWAREVHPLQFLDPAAIKRREELRKEREARQEAAPTVEPTHLLVLKNGDYHYGRIVEETEEEVRFLMIKGAIGAEAVFAKEQIASLKEHEPPS